MEDKTTTRRDCLQALTAGGALTLAGCLGSDDDSGTDNDNDTDSENNGSHDESESLVEDVSFEADSGGPDYESRYMILTLTDGHGAETARLRGSQDQTHEADVDGDVVEFHLMETYPSDDFERHIDPDEYDVEFLSDGDVIASGDTIQLENKIEIEDITVPTNNFGQSRERFWIDIKNTGDFPIDFAEFASSGEGILDESDLDNPGRLDLDGSHTDYDHMDITSNANSWPGYSTSYITGQPTPLERPTGADDVEESDCGGEEAKSTLYLIGEYSTFKAEVTIRQSGAAGVQCTETEVVDWTQPERITE